jgi:hypothetical protein
MKGKGQIKRYLTFYYYYYYNHHHHNNDNSNKCSVKNFLTMRPVLSITAFCLRMYTAGRRWSSFKHTCNFHVTHSVHCSGISHYVSVSDQLNALWLFIRTYILLQHVSAQLRHLQGAHQFDVICPVARCFSCCLTTFAALFYTPYITKSTTTTVFKSRLYWRKLLHWTSKAQLNINRRTCVLFWDITQRRVVILYRRFGTTYRVPSSRVKNYRRYHIHRGGSLKSLINREFWRKQLSGGTWNTCAYRSRGIITALTVELTALLKVFMEQEAAQQQIVMFL